MDYSAATSLNSTGYVGVTHSATSTVKEEKAISSHAERLHTLANEFDGANARLDALLSRLTGGGMVSGANQTDKNPAPAGVLYVAQFGAERLHRELLRLNENIASLEKLA